MRITTKKQISIKKSDEVYTLVIKKTIPYYPLSPFFYKLYFLYSNTIHCMNKGYLVSKKKEAKLEFNQAPYGCKYRNVYNETRLSHLDVRGF